MSFVFAFNKDEPVVVGSLRSHKGNISRVGWSGIGCASYTDRDIWSCRNRYQVIIYHPPGAPDKHGNMFSHTRIRCGEPISPMPAPTAKLVAVNIILLAPATPCLGVKAGVTA